MSKSGVVKTATKKPQGTTRHVEPSPPSSPTFAGDEELNMGDAELDALISSTTAPELSVAKRKPNHQSDQDDEQQQPDAKRSASRLNQVQATPSKGDGGDGGGGGSSTAVVTPVQKHAHAAPIYVMPKRIGYHSTVFGLAEDLAKIKVQAAYGEGPHTEVNFYIVDYNDAKQKAFHLKNGRRLTTRSEGDKVLGLQRAFRFGPARVVSSSLKPLGVLGDASATKGFVGRNHLLMLGPTTDPKDKLREYIQVTDEHGATRWLSTLPFQFTAQTSLEALKRLVKHLFGCMYDGDEYGTTEMRKACLAEVLTEMSREQPGSQLSIPGEVAESCRDADNKAMLTLASGKVLTIDDAEVKKRVRARFIDKCVGPFRADSTDETVRKKTHWSAPETILLARHKVFRRMNADELAQAKKIDPKRGCPTIGSWPSNRPEPSKEDFDDPSKMDECVWYANSKGYMLSPIVYHDKNEKTYQLPLENSQAGDETEHETPIDGGGDGSAAASTTTVAPQDAPTQDAGAPMVFVYKRPKYARRVVTNGSIVAADIRIRLWCNKPGSSNLTGSAGAHADFTPTIIMMDRRENDAGRNGGMGAALTTEMSPEDMERMFAETGGEFAPMPPVHD